MNTPSVKCESRERLSLSDSMKVGESSNQGVPKIVEQEEEEEKMQKFSSLICSIQATINRLQSDLNKSRKQRLKGEKGAWIPCFEWEDFREVIEFKSPEMVLSIGKEEKEEDLLLNLNLNLSL